MSKFTPQSYRILAVDDSASTLQMIEFTLRRAGFQVHAALSGEEALEYIETDGLPHLVIVDVNMPFGMDGFEFCKAVHTFSDLPIILLTAADEEDSIIEEIEQYAEDYMTKPISAGELVARVRRVLRTVGDFRFNLEPLTHVDERLAVNFVACQATVGDASVALTPDETKMLYILMRATGRPTPVAYLHKRLWPQEQPSAARLSAHADGLRQKIEVDPQKPIYIVSRGQGYVFLPDKI